MQVSLINFHLQSTFSQSNTKKFFENPVKHHLPTSRLVSVRSTVINSKMESSSAKISTSMSRNRPSSRPTTPLRPSSRTSLRDSQGYSAGGSSSEFPLESLEPAFAELSDSMADLEANFMHLQLMHESLSRFNESFASFLYGLNMNAFCVDFPEVSLQLFEPFPNIVDRDISGACGRVI